MADERKEQILAAAARAIVERGFESTRIADIARRAGTSTGTVHYYFETKDDVLLAALKWANELPYRHLAQVLAPDDDATAKLAKLIELSVPYPGTPREEWVIWMEYWSRVIHRPELLEPSEEISTQWRACFFDIVREGVASGEFRVSAPVEEVAERLIGLVDGLGVQATVRHRWMPPERFRDLLFRFAAEQLGADYEALDAAASSMVSPTDTAPGSTTSP